MILITIVNGIYKPTSITGGPHIVMFLLQFLVPGNETMRISADPLRAKGSKGIVNFLLVLCGLSQISHILNFTT